MMSGKAEETAGQEDQRSVHDDYKTTHVCGMDMQAATVETGAAVLWIWNDCSDDLTKNKHMEHA